MLYLGYVGFAVPVRFRDGVVDCPAARRRVDSHHAALDHGDLDHFKPPEFLTGAGWAYAVLGWGGYWALGSGGERVAAAVDHGHRVPAFGHDAGKKGHDEGLEHGADLGDILPVHFRDVPDALGIVSSVHAFADRRSGCTL